MFSMKINKNKEDSDKELKCSSCSEKGKVGKILLVSLIFLLGVIFVYINLIQYKLGLNADIASEGLLAKIIWESKEWIPSEWYYSTEMRLISVANCAALFYGIFGNICLAMGLACVVAGIFVFGGAWYLCKELEFKLEQKLLLIFLIMMLPNNKDLLELTFIYAGHYAFHIGLYFITLAVFLKMLKNKDTNRVTIIFILILHFILGIQGVRGILMITGPLMAVEIVRRLYLWWIKQEGQKKDNLITGYVIALNVAGYLGSKIPLSIGHPLSRNIRKAPQKFFNIVLPDFLNTLYWTHLSIIEKIVFLMCIVIILCLSVSIIVKGIKKEKISNENWIFMNFFVSVFLTFFALTFTTVDSSLRYFVVVYYAIAMGITILIDTENKVKKGCLVFMIATIFIGNCFRMYLPMLTDKGYTNNLYAQIAEYLVQEEYEMAYTTFENANMITVYDNGKVQVAAVTSFSDMSVCKWLSSKKWYVPNVPAGGKIAYIVPDHRMEEFLKGNYNNVEFKIKIYDCNIYESDYNYSKLTD